MKVQLFIDPENKLSRVPYQVPNNIHYVKYQDYLDAQTQPDALTAYLYAAELAKDDIKKLKAEVERLKEGNEYLGQMHDKEMERSAYLLEEFNRTTAWGRGLESDLSHARVEISFLKAEVERLKEENEVLQNRCDFLEGRNKE